MQGRERIIRDFRTRRRDGGQESRFPRVRESQQTDIRDHFQFQPHPHFFAGATGVGAARRLIRRSFEHRVAVTAVAAFGDREPFVGDQHILDDRFVVVRDDLRADGDFDDQVFAFAAEFVLSFAVMAAFGLEMLAIAKVDQGVQIGDGFKNHIAAAPAVAAVRAAEFDIFFAAERTAAAAAVAGFQVDFRLIQKFHRFDSPF